MEERRSVSVLTGLEIVFALAAILLYALTVSSFSGFGRSDPVGNRLAEGFAVIAEIILWLLLGAFVGLCCKGGRQGALVSTAGALLCLAGLIASTSSIGMIRWDPSARITPTALPALAFLFGIWARFATGWTPRARVAALAGFGLLAAAAMAPVFLAQARWAADAPAREADRQKAEDDFARAEAATRARIEAEFRALGPDSRLEQYLPHLHGDQEAEAIVGIRAVRSRQADAVRLLDGGIDLYELFRMSEFGLEVTPELCRSFQARVDRRLTGYDPQDATPTIGRSRYAAISRRSNGCVRAAATCRLRRAGSRLNCAPTPTTASSPTRRRSRRWRGGRREARPDRKVVRAVRRRGATQLKQMTPR